MKVLPYTIVLSLAACSMTSLQDTANSKDQPPVENKSNRTTTKSNTTDAATVIVDQVANTDAQITRKKIDNLDPNSLFENSSVYFDLDEYTVKDNFVPVIKQHAEFLLKNPDQLIFVEGHTDERGGAEYNLSLGQKRANAVRMLLIFYGARQNQVEAYSYGSEKPRAMGSNEAAWAQNRRVDLYYKN